MAGSRLYQTNNWAQLLEKFRVPSIIGVTAQTSAREEVQLMNQSGKQRSRSQYRVSKNPFCMTLVCVLLMIFPATAVAATQVAAGILQREINKHHDLIRVRLLGATEYELVEIFNDLLRCAPGVKEARRYRFSLDPQSPEVCMVEWQVRIEDTDPFQLESYLYEMVREAVQEGRGETGPVFTLQPAGVDLERLRDIRPWRASNSEIEFVLYRPWPLNATGWKRPCIDAKYWGGQPGAGFE